MADNLSRLFFEFPQLGEQAWYVVPDDAPKRIVINTQVAMDQPVTGCDDLPPRYRREGTRCSSGICVAASPSNSRLRTVAS
jgi:hypothetical protein